MIKSNKAVSVLVAGTLINMSIGFLYAWSVFKNAMVLPIDQGGWAWTHTEANAAYLEALLSFSNASGRVGGGILSDKIGRLNTMMLVFSSQLLNMAFFNFYTTELMIVIGTVVAGFSYGSLMSTFPSLTADKWGLKFYGGNYGVMYMAWGVSGIVGPLIAGWAIDTTGTYSLACSISAILLGVAIALAIRLRFVKTNIPCENTCDLEPEMA